MLHVELRGAQKPPEEVAKLETTRRAFSAPHFGHSASLPLSLTLRSSSKLLPHSGHSYS